MGTDGTGRLGPSMYIVKGHKSQKGSLTYAWLTVSHMMHPLTPRILFRKPRSDAALMDPMKTSVRYCRPQRI